MDARAELEHVIRHLAEIDNRGSATPGEHEAALWLSDRFEEHGCKVSVDSAPAHGTYWWPMGISAGIGLVGALFGLARKRIIGFLLGCISVGSLIDDVASGPRVLRRYLLPKRTCWNTVATTGDLTAETTVVIIAHHDAPHTGKIFDQSAQKWFAGRFPGVLAKIKTAPPLYWPVIAGPILVALGNLTGSKKLIRLGAVASGVSGAVFLDVGTSPVNQGANDNLSGVAGLVWVARALNENPVQGVKVILASCGSEESFQEGIAAFMAKYSSDLPTRSTYFVNLETVGSPQLLLLEGEGPIVMRDYEKGFKDFVEGVARSKGISLTRGNRARTTTDSLITSRRGYPTATFTSVNSWKALSNYHMLSDTPDNLSWDTVFDAALLAEQIVRSLADFAGL